MGSDWTHSAGLRAELAKLREQLRLKAHLGSLEARAFWRRFEPRMIRLEQELEHRGDQALDLAGNIALELGRALIQHAPKDELGETPVREMMQRCVATCAADDSLRLVAARMAQERCGALVVVSAQREPLAVITDRDVALAACTSERRFAQLRAWHAMSRTAHCCTLECSIVQALAVMRTARVRRLPVVDTTQRLTGMITLDDVAWYVHARAPAGIPTALQAEVTATLAAVATPTIVWRRVSRAPVVAANDHV